MSAAGKKLIVLDKNKAASSKKKQPRTGAAKMRKAADDAVGRDCEPIVKALAENGKKGQTLSARFLYGLAHDAEELGEGESAQTFRGMALELANSPEWKGDDIEDDSEAE
jgi:hypothetical protein